MHCFLIWRYLTLSQKPVVAGILTLPALTAFVGGSLVTWALGAKYTHASDRPKQVTFVTCVPDVSRVFVVSQARSVWLTASVVADILIAAALIFELRRVKTTFKGTQRWRDCTRSVRLWLTRCPLVSFAVSFATQSYPERSQPFSLPWVVRF